MLCTSLPSAAAFATPSSTSSTQARNTGSASCSTNGEFTSFCGVSAVSSASMASSSLARRALLNAVFRSATAKPSCVLGTAMACSGSFESVLLPASRLPLPPPAATACPGSGAGRAVWQMSHLVPPTFSYVHAPHFHAPASGPRPEGVGAGAGALHMLHATAPALLRKVHVAHSHGSVGGGTGGGAAASPSRGGAASAPA